MYESLILAQANESGGSGVLPILVIAGIVFLCFAFSKPKNKGVVIDHQGRTTVKPRK